MTEALVHPRNKLNDLTAAEWISRTVSIFAQKGMGKNSDHARFEKLHPAPFSFTDVTRFIEFFTKAGGRVLDPFGGIGSTAKAGSLLSRYVTSVEVNPYFSSLALQRINEEVSIEKAEKYCKFLCDDIRRVSLTDNDFNLILTSPPYWSILDKVDHKARQERLDNGLHHNYGMVDGDLSKIQDYEDFLRELSSVLSSLATHCVQDAHAVVIVGDFRHKSRYYMFHSDLASAVERAGGWSLKGLKIMYQKHKRVFPYGYPYSYVPNLHHQYALIFQRTKQ